MVYILAQDIPFSMFIGMSALVGIVVAIVTLEINNRVWLHRVHDIYKDLDKLDEEVAKIKKEKDG